MTWEIGQEVVKQVCPKGCICDGAEIPPGSTGVIKDLTTRSNELYIKVEWKGTRLSHRTWWVFEHGLLPEASIPDMFYLDDD